MSAARARLHPALLVVRHWMRSVDLRAPFRVLRRVASRIAARPLVALLVSFALVISVGAIAFAAGVFNVRHVTVVGAGRTTTARIDVLAKSVVGDSMMTVNTSSLRHRVAGLPQVSDVRISRVWPNSLRVTVRERRPTFAVRQPQGWLLIDQTGTPYLMVSRPPAHVLPLAADDTTVASPTVRAAIAVVAALPAQVRRNVVSVDAPSAAGIRLRMRDGATVVWGGPEDSSRKARALAALLHRKAHVYDVSTPGFITTS